MKTIITKRVFGLVIISTLLVILGVGANNAASQGVSLTPEQLVSESLAEMAQATGVSFNVKTTINLSKLTKDQKAEVEDALGIKVPGTAVLTFKGAYDGADLTDERMSIKHAFTAGSLRWAFDLRMIDEQVYAQLTKAPKTDLVPFLKEIEKQWVSFPESESPTDVLTETDRDHLVALARSASLVKITDTESDKKVSGVVTSPISFDLDRQGIVAYVNDVEQYLEVIDPCGCSMMVGSGVTLEDLEAIEDFKGKVWIGKKDNLPYKFSFEFTVTPEPGEPGTIKITTVGTLNKWNKSLRLATPSNATPIEELLEEVIGESMAGQLNFELDDLPGLD